MSDCQSSISSSLASRTSSSHLNIHTINNILTKLREKIAEFCERESFFDSGEIELDESYVGARRVRGRGASGKTVVFGLKKREGKVYTQVIRNCSRSEIFSLISTKIAKDSVLFTDGFKTYDGLVDMGYKKHYRVHHSKNEFSKKQGNVRNHINGIENFWGLAKVRLSKFRGMSKSIFYLHLKECEFRFNHRNQDLYRLCVKTPLTSYEPKVNMKLNIRFIKSAKQKTDWPSSSSIPEIALVGRSNAGKSSLLNCLAEQKEVAKVSRSPGKTRLINFFDVDSKFRFVDLPGYGFAKRSGSEISEWKEMIETYLTERELLKAIILVKDIRRPWANDEKLLYQLAVRLDVEFICVETKMDKLNQSERHLYMKAKKNKTFYLSNVTGEGVQELARYILSGI